MKATEPYRRRTPNAHVLMASLTVALCVAGCSGRKTDPAYAPHEGLLSVLADFERFATLDLYRFHAPADPSGINLFRATVARLANYEGLDPGRHADVLAYARGQAYERLGDYTAAADAFAIVIGMDTPLAIEAAESLAIDRHFQGLLAPAQTTPTMQAYLEALNAQRDGFAALADLYTTGPGAVDPAQAIPGARIRPFYGALAMREVERSDIELAEAQWRHRDLLEDGTARALSAWTALVERHADSARASRNRLRAGDCYYELAREYAQQRDPEGAEFDREAFERMARAALAHYRRVERAYGQPERLEARGKIEAVNAFLNRVLARGR